MKSILVCNGLREPLVGQSGTGDGLRFNLASEVFLGPMFAVGRQVTIVLDRQEANALYWALETALGDSLEGSSR